MSENNLEAGKLEREEQALQDLLEFPLVEALFGRRSRRFFRGAEIPDGPLAYRSRHEPLPLTELERMLILTAIGGTTGWHHSITRHERYAPHLSNYPGSAGGRTFPSAVVSIPAKFSLPTIAALISFRHAMLRLLLSEQRMERSASKSYWTSIASAFVNCRTNASIYLRESHIWRATIRGSRIGLVRCW
jgi:hypothetical protein